MYYEQSDTIIGRPGYGVAPALLRFVQSIWQSFCHQRAYRRLEELPDYLLDDVGLTRADVAAVRSRRTF
jgi:uncharacterized protein YjiS (DUF1127 family)